MVIKQHSSRSPAVLLLMVVSFQLGRPSKEPVPVGSPTQQLGNRLCLMFQTGALSRTGGFLCPSATGLLTDFYSAPRFEQRINEEKKKSMDVWRSTGVCAPQCQSPRRVSSAHLIPEPWLGGLVGCVWTGLGSWSLTDHTEVQLLPLKPQIPVSQSHFRNSTRCSFSSA